ncbi:MAG: DUF697 domain-containing protein [Calditrichaeota bacterium]|nr:DUF697 domain-containing protein [Calditrichota bacterium]
MTIFKRIFTFITFFFIYIIIREFLQIYFLFSSVHPYLGYAVSLFFLFILIYFVAVPVYRILKLNKYPAPAESATQEESVIKERLKIFRNNKELQPYDGKEKNEHTEYDFYAAQLKTKCHETRKAYVRKIFYSTSVAQNGFLDAILILSASVNMVKDIFILYNGRSSIKDLLSIAKKIYYAMAIAGSEGVEIATEELFSKFSTEGLKSVPFIDKILGSIADGYVNALLLTRISFVTENYCQLTLVQNNKVLNPNATFIVTTTKNITQDIVSDLRNALLQLTSKKFKDFTRFAARPVIYVWDIAQNSVQNTGSSLKNILWLSGGSYLNKVTSVFSKIRY